MPLSVNFTRLMYVGLAFSVPGTTFDLDSLGFEVLACGSLAKHNAAPNKQSAKINRIVFVFMRRFESGSPFPVNISLFAACRLRRIGLIGQYFTPDSASQNGALNSGGE